MLLYWLASDLVVHQSGAVVLERCSKLINDRLVGSLLSLLSQNEIHLDNLLVGIGQVVLASHRARH